jgi:putative phosphoesterase
MVQTLLVLSDSHGNLPALEAALSWAKTRVEAAFFLGDGADDLAPASAAAGFEPGWKKVRGNGDGDFTIPAAETADIGGRRFFLTHGHQYALHNGFTALVSAARNLAAEAALFGHTHVPFFYETGGILLLNPGSVGRPRSRIGATFALIECPPGKPLAVRFWGIDPAGNIRKLEI